MIATIEGNVASKTGSTVVLEAGGIGYGLLVTFEDFGAINVAGKAKLYVYESIRENS